MTPDDAFDEHERQPFRCAAGIRKFLIVTGGILSSIVGVIVAILFLIIF